MKPAEKNQLYHTILQIIKTLPPEQAAQDILFQFEEYIEYNIDNNDSVDEEVPQKMAKESPIFRRSG